MSRFLSQLVKQQNHLLSFAFFIAGIVPCGVLLLYFSSSFVQAKELSQIDLYIPVKPDSYQSQLSQIDSGLKELGFENIAIKTGQYTHSYQIGLRAGRPGLYFSPPHFASWAIKHHGFIPLIHLSEPLAYVLAVERNRTSLFEVNDLAGRTVCARKPLNLDYLLINQVLKKSLVPAKVEIFEQVSTQMDMQNSICDAFSIPRKVFDDYDKKQPERFIKIYQTTNYTNYGLISHPDLQQADLKKLRDYFMLDKTQAIMTPLLKGFAEKPRFVKSTISSYPENYTLSLQPYWQKSP